MPRRHLNAALIAAVLVLVALAYAPGLSGPFVFDDAPNILEPPGVQMRTLDLAALRAAATSNHSGPLGRPLSAVSFAANHYLAGGFDSAAFKITNLLIHLGCVLLGAGLVRRLLQLAPLPHAAGALYTPAAPWTLAAAVALLWGLHPVNLTSVLYVVQRMTSLSALLVLAGLLVWLEGRRRLGTARGGLALMTAGVALGAGVGVLAKENAVLMPLYAAVIELTLLRDARAALGPVARRQLRWFWAVILGVPALAGAVVLALHPEIVTAGYAGRPFSLTERVLTQARVLWFYVSLIGVPDITRYGLYHDDFQVSTGLLRPATTLAALLGWAWVIASAVALRARAPWLVFGVAWFLAGHALESTVLPLELVHEHRNYLPALGLIAGVVVSMAALPLRPALRGALVGGLAGMLALVTATRAYTWSDDTAIIQALYRHHPQSAAANRMMAELALKRAGNPVEAVEYYTRAAQLAPHETGYALWPLVLRGALHLPPAVATDEVQSAERALRVRPLTPSTLYVLRNLADCVDRGLPDCAGMDGAIARWLAGARDATPAGERRKSLTVDLARVYLATDRFDEGAALLAQALDESPGDGMYLTIGANFALLRGELDQADMLLNAAAAAPAWAQSAAHIATLRQAVEERRQGATATVR